MEKTTAENVRRERIVRIGNGMMIVVISQNRVLEEMHAAPKNFNVMLEKATVTLMQNARMI